MDCVDLGGCHISSFQGSTGTRGSSGEPLATSYHSKFLGTVDYLW